ncbi:DUF3313 domain-containing protein [Pseudomonas sp. JS3066]|uniref:DUF3313 domain-containing protein n=1 Tax=Pseudomonas sp. JS3066 TaxID=3090665 RepID=UPI002E7C22A4|nr:DUF3313 domain-containing protein [Pseudomonas sp. JS3066]WVK91587.1 DUF3313 domain-containing protein [Pseudomonas sp. JS3066]
MHIKELSILTLSMVLCGCSMAPSIDTTDISTQPANAPLRVIERDEGTIAWKKYPAPLSSDHDKSVFIDLPKSFATNGQALTESDADISKLLRHFRGQLERQLSSAGYRLVDRPTPGALSLRVSISDLKRKPRDPNVTEYIPIGMLIGLSLHVTGVRDETLYVFFESEVSDGRSGETLARAVDRAKGRNIGQSDKPVVEDIYPALDASALQIRERLDREFQHKGPA